MAFNKTGSATFTTGGELHTFNFVVTVADEKLHLEIEDIVSYEKWQTTHLAINDFVTEDTVIPQAKAIDYAAIIVQGLEQSVQDEATRSTYSSLSKPSSTDQSRLLCVSFPLQILARLVTAEYTFELWPQPVDHVQRLTRENERLQAQINKLTRDNEQLTRASATEREKCRVQIEKLTRDNEQLSRKSATDTERHRVQIEKLTCDNEQLIRKSATETETHRVQVFNLTREIEQLKRSTRKPTKPVQPPPPSLSTTDAIRPPAPTMTAVVKPCKNPRVFVDLYKHSAYGDGAPFRIEIELFCDITPKAAEFFRWLVTSQSGWFKNTDMTGGHGIFTCPIDGFVDSYQGDSFAKEVSSVKHDSPGIVSMCYYRRPTAAAFQIIVDPQNVSAAYAIAW